ncbi:outer membrane protein assembly factor BamB family protein [Thermobifida cellulosilytica]|uniref:Pyrrolo-quinoline quinone repeat domain-containing protein n=1 Tax=Thermobifida cellulosilytica TB100 TaxID=665004 RepID=A0A147KL06_THECS|nr:PQQ-binding-like beta-propeller repeat protein [Thermobifida cellulosilytica]KUP97994.1 hypothetical protein AC529_03310 [Thermobifida cellulosilytica TB100]
MRSGRRRLWTLVTGVILLSAAVSCTDRDAPPEPAPSSPRPLPTVYEGEAPPGLADTPLRYLHDPQEPAQEILDDPRGVRIHAVGDAFLISSNSEERHLLQEAADGRVLWRGESRVERFTQDRTGADVFEVSTREGDRVTRSVVDAAGRTVWTSSDPRESYLNGLVVRAPADWSASEPYGEFVIREPAEGGVEWSYEFTAPEDPARGDAQEDGDKDAEDEEAAAHLGVPVGARDEVVLLDDGAGLLQARDLADDGALLWRVSGDSVEAPDGRTLSTPRPHLVGFYTLPAAEKEEDAPTGAEESAEPDETAEPRWTVLVRWSSPEESSLLSLHDLRDGTTLWTLGEPGSNPLGDSFGATPVPGTVWDGATGTLLVPQADAATTVIAVDLAAGERLWSFDSVAERSVSPRFALAGYVYGDSRADDDGSQVVFEATTKDVVADDLTGYVEAVTDNGHALVVQDRQRFVFAPETPPKPTAAPSLSPTERG